MAVTNLKLVAGQKISYDVAGLGYTITEVTAPVTNDSPFYIHVQLLGGASSYVQLVTANDIGTITAHTVLPGQVKTFGPYQADSDPYGVAIYDGGETGTCNIDFSVFQSGGNKQTPVIMSKESELIDVSDESETYIDLIDFWDFDVYPDFAPTNLTCSVYVVLYVEDVDWLSVLPTGTSTGGSNSALIVNRGESIVLGPYNRENMPVVYTPASAGTSYSVSLDIVKRGS